MNAGGVLNTCKSNGNYFIETSVDIVIPTTILGIETNKNHKKENFIYENINYHYSTDC